MLKAIQASHFVGISDWGGTAFASKVHSEEPSFEIEYYVGIPDRTYGSNHVCETYHSALLQEGGLWSYIIASVGNHTKYILQAI